MVLNEHLVKQSNKQICENVKELSSDMKEQEAMCNLQKMLTRVCPVQNDIPPLSKSFRAWPFSEFPKNKQLYSTLDSAYFSTYLGDTRNKMTWNTAATWCTANGGHLAQSISQQEMANVAELIVANMKDRHTVEMGPVHNFNETNPQFWLGAVRNFDSTPPTDFVWVGNGHSTGFGDDLWSELSEAQDANCM